MLLLLILALKLAFYLLKYNTHNLILTYTYKCLKKRKVMFNYFIYITIN